MLSKAIECLSIQLVTHKTKEEVLPYSSHQELFLGRFRSSRFVLGCSSLLWVMTGCSGCSSFYKRRLHIIFSLSDLLKIARIWTRIFTRWGSCTVIQNRASVITKWENFFVLQSRVSGITKQVGFAKWDNFYYKKRRNFYYKVGLVLLSGIFVTNQGAVIITLTTTTLQK